MPNICGAQLTALNANNQGYCPIAGVTFFNSHKPFLTFPCFSRTSELFLPRANLVQGLVVVWRRLFTLHVVYKPFQGAQGHVYPQARLHLILLMSVTDTFFLNQSRIYSLIIVLDSVLLLFLKAKLRFGNNGSFSSKDCIQHGDHLDLAFLLVFTQLNIEKCEVMGLVWRHLIPSVSWT